MALSLVLSFVNPLLVTPSSVRHVSMPKPSVSLFPRSAKVVVHLPLARKSILMSVDLHVLKRSMGEIFHQLHWWLLPSYPYLSASQKIRVIQCLQEVRGPGWRPMRRRILGHFILTRVVNIWAKNSSIISKIVVQNQNILCTIPLRRMELQNISMELTWTDVSFASCEWVAKILMGGRLFVMLFGWRTEQQLRPCQIERCYTRCLPGRSLIYPTSMSGVVFTMFTRQHQINQNWTHRQRRQGGLELMMRARVLKFIARWVQGDSWAQCGVWETWSGCAGGWCAEWCCHGGTWGGGWRRVSQVTSYSENFTKHTCYAYPSWQQWSQATSDWPGPARVKKKPSLHCPSYTVQKSGITPVQPLHNAANLAVVDEVEEEVEGEVEYAMVADSSEALGLDPLSLAEAKHWRDSVHAG